MLALKGLGWQREAVEVINKAYNDAITATDSLSMNVIYLDYAATTPADPRVVEKMLAMLGPDANFGNPASRSHFYGWLADEAVEQARRQIADLLHADPREIVFTSGATESNNLAIKGVAARHPGGHIITSSTALCSMLLVMI